MTKREKMKGKVEEDDENDMKKSVILLTSSDDEEANGDLSLEIVEKARARARENKRKRGEDKVISLSSSSSDDVEVVADLSNGGIDVTASIPELPKKKNRKKKKDKNISKQEKQIKENTFRFVDEEKALEVKLVETNPAGIGGTEVVKRAKPMDTEAVGVVAAKVVEGAKPMETEGAEIVDNVVLRKLLRGPRYFDPPSNNWSSCNSCFNCGEEGHMAANCTAKKRKKPCFVCGSFEHGARHCKQGLDCYICKKTGHRARNCPDKNLGGSQISTICLRCGDSGHNMFSCTSDYDPSDLKEIQCYICRRFGHLCCVDFIDTGRREVTCYNCGQSGHTGLGCAKQRGETSEPSTPTLCYKCGGEGHFARGCTKYSKPNWRKGEFSTPVQHFPRGGRDDYGVQSLPHDIKKPHKKKRIPYDEGLETFTPVKPKHRGGWIPDDHEEFPNWKYKENGWRSPATPAQKIHKNSNFKKGYPISSSRSPSKKAKFSPVSPNSYGSAKSYHHHQYSASRFSNSSSSRGRRNYDW